MLQSRYTILSKLNALILMQKIHVICALKKSVRVYLKGGRMLLWLHCCTLVSTCTGDILLLPVTSRWVVTSERHTKGRVISLHSGVCWWLKKGWGPVKVFRTGWVWWQEGHRAPCTSRNVLSLCSFPVAFSCLRRTWWDGVKEDVVCPATLHWYGTNKDVESEQPAKPGLLN